MPDWAGLIPASIVALGTPARPVDRLMGLQSAVYRLIVLFGNVRVPSLAHWRRPSVGSIQPAREGN